MNGRRADGEPRRGGASAEEAEDAGASAGCGGGREWREGAVVSRGTRRKQGKEVGRTDDKRAV